MNIMPTEEDITMERKTIQEMMNDPVRLGHLNHGKRVILRMMLYDRKITIPEFKEYCEINYIDYNNFEHCCACAGCYEPDEHDPEGSQCPDYDVENKPPCQIMDPNFCAICGKPATIGYPLEDKDDKVVEMFWTCEDHECNPKIEKDLRKGVPTYKIVQKWNK